MERSDSERLTSSFPQRIGGFDPIIDGKDAQDDGEADEEEDDDEPADDWGLERRQM